MVVLWVISYVIESHKTSYDGYKEIEAGSGNDTNSGFRKNSDYLKLDIQDAFIII